MKKILISVDGSKCSKKAVKKARYIAELTDAKIGLLHVLGDISINYPYVVTKEHVDAVDSAYKKQSEIIMKESKEILRKSNKDLEIKTIIKHGDPGKVIIETAEEEEYDLVVMGSRGLNAISRAMLGSVSNKVLNHIDKSVLIVK